MLIFGSRIHGTPVMSLQTGTRLATINEPLIDPSNLKILAYTLEGPLLTHQGAYLRTDDIRELGNLGMIIDSEDEFVEPDDVIKLKHIRELGFRLIGMPVIDEHKHKLGKVEDYTIDTPSFTIQQLTVKHGFLKSLSDTGTLIHRSQIIEVNDNTIIVKATTKKLFEPVIEATRNEYVNPFRSPKPEQGEA